MRPIDSRIPIRFASLHSSLVVRTNPLPRCDLAWRTCLSPARGHDRQQCSLKYLAQFPFLVKRLIQLQLIARHGNTTFTFRQVAQEAAFQELNYAIMDSRDPVMQKAQADASNSAYEPDPPPLPVRSFSRGGPNTVASRKPRQQVANVRPAPSLTLHQQTVNAVASASTDRRCHRRSDLNHHANVCPQTDLQCRHCQGKGLLGRRHTDRACFGLHPELIPSHRRPRNQVGYAAPTRSLPLIANPT